MTGKYEHVLVIGVGGGGGRIMRTLASRHVGDWLQLAYVDSDLADLEFLDGVLQIPVGEAWTQGVGCGGDAVLGENIVGAGLDDLRELLQNAGLVIIVGCLGGGTGSGGMQVLTRLLREEKRLGFGFVTLPLAVEGSERGDTAREALDALRTHNDVIVAVDNDLAFHQVPPDTPISEALSRANSLIVDGIVGLAEIVRCREGISIDYADLRSMLQERPAASTFGTGRARGENRAADVIANLFDAPLLGGREFLQEAHAVIGALTGGPSLSVSEMDQCLNELHEKLNPLTRTMLGAAALPQAPDDELSLTLLAIQYDRPTDRVDRTSRAIVQRTKTMKLISRSSQIAVGSEVTGVLGIFGNAAPTVRQGENLDIPSFLRRGISLEKVRSGPLPDDADDEE